MTAGGARRVGAATGDRRPPRGVILDVDGTLVDSNRLHARAWHDAFAAAGLDGGSVDRIERLIGMGSDKLLPAAVGISADSDEGRRLSERRGQIFMERYLPLVRPFDRAAALVQALHGRGLGLAVATSAKPYELRALLARAGVAWLADQATSGDQVAESKPDPDVVEAALGRLNLPADRVVMIGDTPYDVDAGRRAGVAVIAVRCGGWSDEDLDGAVAVYDGPSDLLAHLRRSPLAA